MVQGGRGHWWTDRLWVESADLPIVTVPIDSIAEFDMDCWFHGGSDEVPSGRHKVAVSWTAPGSRAPDGAGPPVRT